jgi:hypothetical protein
MKMGTATKVFMDGFEKTRRFAGDSALLSIAESVSS